jgi:hypothetical protein
MSNSKGFTEADVPQQTGKSFIVTGAACTAASTSIFTPRRAKVWREYVSHAV